MLSKAVLRQAFRTNLNRDDHDTNALAAALKSLIARLNDFLKTQTGIWAGFEPHGFEPDIRPALASATHLQWVYPRVEGQSLKFYEVGSRNDLVQNQWQLWEPDPKRARAATFDELHGMLIPGLAFDTSCRRLGRGCGFYDRAFAEIARVNQPLKIGVALERQLASQDLPSDAHDVAMDLVLTESRTLNRPPSAAAFKGILP